MKESRKEGGRREGRTVKAGEEVTAAQPCCVPPPRGELTDHRVRADFLSSVEMVF